MSRTPTQIAAAARPRSRVVGVVRYLFIMGLIALVLLELGVRIMTHTDHDGIQRFGKVSLVPLRPEREAIRRALDRSRDDPLLMRDPDLGWVVRPNKNDDGNKTNAQGIRADPSRVFAMDPPPAKVRVLTVGDSFVYCSDVDNGQTWQDSLERRRADLELINMGVPGSATDQGVLRWQRDGKPFKPHLVLLGIWPDNMFRNLSIVNYYRAQADLTLTKPRLARDGAGGWRFVNAPIISEDELTDILTHPEDKPILRYEYWYNAADTQPTLARNLRLVQFLQSGLRRLERRDVYNKIYTGEIPDGIDVTVALAQLFAKDVKEAGAIPLVVMIPDRERLPSHVADPPFPLVKALRAAGIDVLDLGPAFGAEVIKNGPAKYYVGGVGHHSPFGNEVFAGYLETELRPWITRAQSLTTPAPSSGK